MITTFSAFSASAWWVKLKLPVIRVRRSMIMTDGSLLAIAARPATAVILVLAVLFFALPFLLRLYARVSGRQEIAELVEADVG